MSNLNDSFITQVYTSYVDLASFSRRLSAREPCGQFWDENEKLCRALASILLGSRCPEKHSIESKLIGTIFAPGITFLSVSRPTDFWSWSIIYIWCYEIKNESVGPARRKWPRVQKWSQWVWTRCCTFLGIWNPVVLTREPNKVFHFRLRIGHTVPARWHVVRMMPSLHMRYRLVL